MGANQPGTRYFSESHSRSKAIYKATISDECRTSHSCLVSMDSGCEVDMFKKDVQSVGYKQMNTNASGAFLIDSTETAMKCMNGKHVEFGQDTGMKNMGTWTCKKLRGLLKAIINKDSAKIAVEMRNIVEENVNHISHEENVFLVVGD